MPFSPHGVINSSPIAGAGDQTCGEVLLGGFLAEPTAPVNDGCAAQAATVDFAGDDGLQQLLDALDVSGDD